MRQKQQKASYCRVGQKEWFQAQVEEGKMVGGAGLEPTTSAV